VKITPNCCKFTVVFAPLSWHPFKLRSATNTCSGPLTAEQVHLTLVLTTRLCLDNNIAMRNNNQKLLFSLLLILQVSVIGFSQNPNVQANGHKPTYYLCEDDLIEIMFIESSRVRLRNSQPTDLISDATIGIDSILNSLQWHNWFPFSDIDETMIDRWAEDGERNTGQKLYNLNNIFRLQIPKGHDIWEISRNLEALPGIYLARPVPKPMPLPLPGNYQSQQGYLNSASSTPTGIDALWSWTQTGGTGSGITVCDLEYSWNYNHADITKAIGSQINVNVVDPFSDNNHGTAVIGMLVADNNGWGVTGICYGANLKTCGTYYGSPTPVWNVPGAIALAIANLSPGDIILLEQQWDYTSSGGYIPIEWWLNYSPFAQTNNGVYAAIQTAVANGIHVVEAGGNGNYDTQALTWFGNSGAIIVGAGGAYPGGTYPEGDLQRLSFSSYGPRFDMQGWGENVVTTAYGDLYSTQGVNYYYTSTFAGTSSASPVVAAAVACFQGYLNANTISGFSPSLVRSQLSTWGTPQIFPPAGQIGPRPDLNNAVLNIPPLLDYDWGDAPDPLYPTLAASIGANHQIVSSIRLGNFIDAEPDGLPTINADGDDLNNLPDEDGITFLWPLAAGNPCRIKVNASTNYAYFSGWSDFNQNGSWADPQENVFSDLVLQSGDNYLTFIVPPGTLPGFIYSRFRYSTQPGLSFTGTAPDGEVEDYKNMVEEYGNIKWQQIPGPELPGLHAHDYMYGPDIHRIVLADDWECYGGLVTDIHWWGNYEIDHLGNENRGLGISHFHLSIHNNDPLTCLPLDPEVWGIDVPFGMVNEQFTGMFNNEGCKIYSYEFILPAPFDQLAGNRYWLDITAASNDPNVPPMWRWQEANRSTSKILCGAANKLEPGINPWTTILWNDIPPFIYSDMAFAITSGNFTDDLDFGDAPDGPYPTLSANNGARHMIIPGMHLGASVDPEPDGQHDPFAMGDDMNGIDDEDGVIFLNSFVRGQNVNLQVSAAGSGYINAWFDWNTNGSWAEAGEHAIIDWLVNAGVHFYTVTVPAGATPAFTFSRFRFSSIQNPGFDGSAPDGEVEDYCILINEPEDHKMHYPQYPDPGGWDVNFSFPHRIGDDWMCTETGLVEDFHFWVSWRGDMVPEDFGVHFRLEIFSDIPADPADPLSYSKPGLLLWEREFAPTMYAYELVFEHPQGWYDPFIPEHQIWDHHNCYRVDIEDFPEPFMQEEGTIYWLVITAVVPGGGGIVYEAVILTLDNIDPNTPAYQTWVEDQAVLSIQDHPIAGPPPSFGFDPGGVWLTPAMLQVDFSAYAGKIINVEVDIIDFAGIGATEAILYDGGAVVDSQQNTTSGVPETLYLNNTGLAYHPDLLTISSYEGYVFEIRFTLELQGGDEYKIGWKTSPDHFQDVAVRESTDPDIAWEMLHNPVTGEPLSLSFIITGNPPDFPFDYGDAPEDALAYPATGVIGQFPTCINVGPPGSFIQHNNFGAFFGPSVDFEPEGNAGFCPTFNPNMYDQDECFNDGDAGLLHPGAFTIVGPPGAEVIVACPGAPAAPLGNICTTASWGGNIDFHLQNLMPNNTVGYVNVLFDWDHNGIWTGFSTCMGGQQVPEHILVNHIIPNGFVGPLSATFPPPFFIGPVSGYVWARISITEQPVPSNWNGSGIFEDGETEDYIFLVLPDPNINLQNITVPGGQTTCYEAAQTITTAGAGTTFIAQSSAVVYLIAGQNIIMKDGTHFKNGSYVHAYIDQTGEYCSNPKAIVFEQEPLPKPLPFEIAEKDLFFKVYPNPNTGQFTLELSELSEFSTIKVEIFSLIGESIMSVELPEMQQYQFDLSAKQPGIYLIRVMRGKEVGVEKVIKR
jgi:hypothetical protein